MNNKKKVVIYTDGACSGNPGPGGWGAVLSYNGKEKEISGAEDNTTNNRMELRAAIESLKLIKEPCQISIYTDSNYVKDGITKWIHSWKAKGWKTASKKEPKNMDLWKELDIEANKHEISWNWVKGHDGDPGNERADLLARNAIIF